MLTEDSILQIKPPEVKKRIILQLRAAGIYTLQDLLNTSSTELRRCPGIGRLAFRRIEEALGIHKLSLSEHFKIANSTGVKDKRYR